MFANIFSKSSSSFPRRLALHKTPLEKLCRFLGEVRVPTNGRFKGIDVLVALGLRIGDLLSMRVTFENAVTYICPAEATFSGHSPRKSVVAYLSTPPHHAERSRQSSRHTRCAVTRKPRHTECAYYFAQLLRMLRRSSEDRI